MKRRGFTLVELLVVVSIMLVITSVLLIRQQQFDSTTLLRTLSYSVALSVRQTQVYGTSVRAVDSLAADPTFDAAYGLYFAGANTTTYTLFADLDNNSQYDSATETIEIFTLPSGFRINGACVVKPDDVTKRCTSAALDSSGGAMLTHMHILFRRPNPEPMFTAYSGAATIPGDTTYMRAAIQIGGTGGTTRNVAVSSTGQIVVSSVGSSI